MAIDPGGNSGRHEPFVAPAFGMPPLRFRVKRRPRMPIRTPYLALAACFATLTVGCGGGDDSAPMAPQAQRSQALAVRAAAVSPVIAADQLMNYGEATYPALFPGRQPTLSFGPFRYRAYSSGILLGVVVSADPAYQLNGVYVMGGPYGQSPLYVGKVTDFITPTEPGPGPVGPTNGCFNVDMLVSNGNTVSVTYQLLGPVTGSLTVDTAYNGFATFLGESFSESIVREKGTTFENNLPTAVDNSEKRYVRKTAEAEITHVGTSSATMVTTNDYIATTTYTTQYTPAWLDRRYALPLGETLTSARTTATTRVTTYSNGLPSTTNTYGSSVSETVTFAARENITVPAGTFSTCRFDSVTTTGTPVTTSRWYVAGKGVLVKEVRTEGSKVQTRQATQALLNTTPL